MLKLLSKMVSKQQKKWRVKRWGRRKGDWQVGEGKVWREGKLLNKKQN